MGLFGFGKKKRQSEDAQQAAEEQAVDEAAAQEIGRASCRERV